MAGVPLLVQALMAEISAEFPDFKVLMKEDSRLMKAIDTFLKVITFGGMKSFLTDYITTIGYTVYFPKDVWGDPDPFGNIVTLRHERVHMRQRRKYGMFLFTLLYVLLPLPGGLAYFRMKFEREAYSESILAVAELSFNPETTRDKARRETIITGFTGPSYFYMWPFRKPIEAWYDETAAAAIASVKSKLPRA